MSTVSRISRLDSIPQEVAWVCLPAYLFFWGWLVTLALFFKAIITATASVVGNFLAPPLLEMLKLQWRLKTAMAVMLLVPLGLFSLKRKSWEGKRYYYHCHHLQHHRCFHCHLSCSCSSSSLINRYHHEISSDFHLGRVSFGEGFLKDHSIWAA